MTSWFQSFGDGLLAAIERSNDQMEAARQRAIDNPGDINTAANPDYVAGISSMEKPMYNAILTGMQNATGHDLSHMKKD